ncbi:MAG: hypothetical protein GX237_10225 [Clostridiales bacterium]|nr:hypothetical protein [Clostridiales bacterium]
MENLNRFVEGFKGIFSLKKTKVTIYIVAVLWLSVITQVIMNRVFFSDFQIAEAFVMTNTEEMECDLEVIAEYNNDFLSETDKNNILHHVAKAIGLNMDKDITISKEDGLTEYSYYKKAKLAETSIKVVSVEQEVDSVITMKHCLVVRLNIKESIKAIEKYRKLIKEALNELDIKQKQVTVQYEGSVAGEMSVKDKEEMAQLLVKELQGQVVFNHQQGQSYTVYAYTGLIDEYIESVGCKINIQIALTYDEDSDRTKLYLASPIINQSW